MWVQMTLEHVCGSMLTKTKLHVSLIHICARAKHVQGWGESGDERHGEEKRIHPSFSTLQCWAAGQGASLPLKRKESNIPPLLPSLSCSSDPRESRLEKDSTTVHFFLYLRWRQTRGRRTEGKMGIRPSSPAPITAWITLQLKALLSPCCMHSA